MVLDPRFDYVNVLRNKKERAVYLEELMEQLSTGALTVCGDIKVLDEPVLGNEVLEALNRFHVKPRLKPTKVTYSAKEQREFARSFDVVSVTRDRKHGTIEFTPMYQSTSTGLSRGDNSIVLGAAQANDPAAIRVAVQKCFEEIELSQLKR